jgi:tetratricopeptide (TPR) repeat protein
MKLFLSFTVLSLFALSVGAASLEKARAALQEKKYAEAFDEYADLIFEDATQPARVHYEQGLAALGMGDEAQAAACFERAVTLNPALLQARVALARCYVDLGLRDAARDQLNRILAGPVPSEVRNTVGRYLSFLEDAEKRWRLSGGVEVSGFHDSNVNYGPLRDRIDTPLGKLRFNGVDSVSAWGLGLGLDTDISYRLSQDVEGWYLFNGLLGYQSVLERSADDYNLLTFRDRAGLRNLSSDTLYELAATYGYLEQGDNTLMNAYGLEAAASYLQTDRLCHSVRARYEYRDYFRSFADWGNYYSLDYSARYAFDQDGRTSVRLLTRVFDNETDYDASDNYGCEAHLIGEYSLPFGLQAYAGGGWRYSKYGDIMYPIIQKDKREDSEAIGTAGLRKRLPYNMQTDLSYRYSRTFSNFDLYDYDREIVMVSFTWRF